METITLSPKAIDRLFLVRQVIEDRCSVKDAAKSMRLSERQVYRLLVRFRKEGPKCLVHRNRGRTPAHATPADVKSFIVDLAQGAFRGANFTHFSELLAEYHQLQLSSKTIGRILKQAGIASKRSHAKPRRFRKRKRRSREGELVQMDASPFAWLEERGPTMSLHGAIDDATGKVLGLFFRPTEDTIGYLQVLKQILKRGIPSSFYTDRHGIFVPANPGALSREEQLAGKMKAHTQFGKAMEDLDIELIEALSPQAKGRVERLWGTLQDRMVIELRLAGIKTIDEANRFVGRFIERFNQRFSVEAESTSAAYRPLLPSLDIDFILTLREERKAASDSTISIKRNLYSLIDSDGRTATFRRNTPVQIRTTLEGEVLALVEGKRYSIKPWRAETKVQDLQGQQIEGQQESSIPDEKPKSRRKWGRFCINPEQTQRFWQNKEARQPGAAGPPGAK